jgi:hypothetical protein
MVSALADRARCQASLRAISAAALLGLASGCWPWDRFEGGGGDDAGIDELDADGVDADGLDADGLDAHGLDAHGLDAHGLDAHGLDAHGLDAQVGDGSAGDAGRDVDASPPMFRSPTRVFELSTSDDERHPTLTDDLLEIYFMSNRAGTSDIWRASRADGGATWDPPERVTELSTEGSEATPGITGDGLTIYFSRDDDIYVSTRSGRGAPWSSPTLVPELSSIFDDESPAPARDGLHLYLASDRRGGRDLFVSTRTAPGSPWGVPELLALSTPQPDRSPMSPNERAIYFDSDMVTGMLWPQIMVARRGSAGDAFGPAAPIPEIDSDHLEQDPWVSEDETVIFFARYTPEMFYEIYSSSP